MKLTTRLKQLRAQAGLSQSQIAKAAGISLPGYIKVENGQRTPSEKLIGKLTTVVACVGKFKSVRQELLLLKLLNDKSDFTREVAGWYAVHTGQLHLVVDAVSAKHKKTRTKSS